MSVLEQVMALGEQLNPEERQLVIDTWLTATEAQAGTLSPETARILDEALARYRSGTSASYSLEEVLERARMAKSR